MHFLFTDPSPTEIYTLSLHDALPISDYLALITRFAAHGVIGDMDCVYSSWATGHPRGFEDGQIEALTGLMPKLALAVKCVRSEEHTSELQSLRHLVCRLLLEKKNRLQ